MKYLCVQPIENNMHIKLCNTGLHALQFKGLRVLECTVWAPPRVMIFHIFYSSACEISKPNHGNAQKDVQKEESP